MPSDFLIAGAGIAGLTAARDLLRAGAGVTVFEAADRIGGQVASQRIAGVDLDAAAESFALRDDTVATLVRELGLGDRIVTPRPTPAWLIRDDGTSGPLPATGLLGVPSDLHAAVRLRAAEQRIIVSGRWGMVRQQGGPRVRVGRLLRGQKSRHPRRLRSLPVRGAGTSRARMACTQPFDRCPDRMPDFC